jgi:signal transduction histidine kinase
VVKNIPADQRVSMSAIALDTILQDLILNAIEAMPETGGVLDIAADSDPPRLRVRDSGPGVDPATLPVIFQVGWSSKGGGRGLGLSRVRSVAEASGASICVRTGPLGGAEFQLEFRPREAFIRR